MAKRLSDGLTTAIASALGVTILANAFIDLWDAAQPASPNSAHTGNKLLTYSVGGGSGANDGFEFSAAAAGVVARDPAQSVYGTGLTPGGTVLSGRVRLYADSSNATDSTLKRYDFSVGLTGSGADMEMESVAITIGATYPLGTFTLTVPGA